jgi:hypothetical protein
MRRRRNRPCPLARREKINRSKLTGGARSTAISARRGKAEKWALAVSSRCIGLLARWVARKLGKLGPVVRIRPMRPKSFSLYSFSFLFLFLFIFRFQILNSNFVVNFGT